MLKSLKDIALPITEEEYRNDGCMHYSTLATYERGGFNAISTLGERKESASLTFGSCVDALITGGRDEFDAHFLVAEFPPLEPAYINIVKALFDECGSVYSSLNEVPDSTIIIASENVGFYRNWKPETRAKVVKEKCGEYYNLLQIAANKTIIDTATYQKVMDAVRALKTSPATQWYFADDSGDGIERVYQAKFKATFDGIEYSCMAD